MSILLSESDGGYEYTVYEVGGECLAAGWCEGSRAMARAEARRAAMLVAGDLVERLEASEFAARRTVRGGL